MTLFADTRRALEGRLNTLTNKPPIAWENAPFRPTESTTFFAAFVLPSPSTLADLASNQEDRGVFQVDVYIPLEKGTAVLTAWADLVCNHFKRQKLTSGSAVVRIGACSHRYVGQEGSWYKGIIEINYVCYSS